MIERCKSCAGKLIYLKTFNNYKFTSFNISSYKKINLKLIFLVCKNCALIQIKKNFILNKKKYNQKFIQKEPDTHLNKIVNKIKTLNIDKKIKIFGISYKDKSLIQKLKKIGYKNSKILNFNSFKKSHVSFENIDYFMKTKFAKEFVKKEGKANMIISRHFFEHNFSISSFFSFIKTLIDQKKKSYLLLEIPDSHKQLKNNDYSMIWEQHKLYPTKFTLNNILDLNNFREIFCHKANYKYEDCLVVFYGFKEKFNKVFDHKYKKKVQAEIKMAKNYFKKFNQFKIKIEKKLNILSANKKIFFYGAGHQTLNFFNIFNLKKFISGVFDDGKLIKNLEINNTNLKVTKFSSNFHYDNYIITNMQHNAEKKLVKKIRSINTNAKIIPFSILNKKSIFWMK